MCRCLYACAVCTGVSHDVVPALFAAGVMACHGSSAHGLSCAGHPILGQSSSQPEQMMVTSDVEVVAFFGFCSVQVGK